MIVGYTTWGSVRGMGDIRLSREAAERDQIKDGEACAAQRGYSDRGVYAIDDDGWLRSEDGSYVYSRGGSRAVRIDLANHPNLSREAEAR